MITKNCGIFIDYDNIWISTETKYEINLYDLDFIDKIRKKISKAYWLPKAPKIEYNICNISAYSNFDSGKIQKDKHQTKLQKLGVHTTHAMNGKNTADIMLASDVLQSLYEQQNLDTYIFLTCDKDILPIVNKIKEKGKEAVIISLTLTTDWDVFKNYGDYNLWFEEILNLPYEVPKTKEKITKNIFMFELKNQLTIYPRVHFSAFNHYLELKYNTDRSTNEDLKDCLAKENKIELFSYENNNRRYFDAMKIL